MSGLSTSQQALAASDPASVRRTMVVLSLALSRSPLARKNGRGAGQAAAHQHADQPGQHAEQRELAEQLGAPGVRDQDRRSRQRGQRDDAGGDVGRQDGRDEGRDAAREPLQQPSAGQAGQPGAGHPVSGWPEARRVGESSLWAVICRCS